MKTDIEIAQAAQMEPINQIAAKIGLNDGDLEKYGKYKAKIKSYRPNEKLGKLILVTAMSPTKAGEGKTTTSVGLADALSRRGKKTILALREPSLGPSFGMKGGACGGGYAQVVPMEDINLHFTGDIHAITAAHDLLAAMVDNHVYQGNELKINPDKIVWNRVVDLNDRALRRITVAEGGKNSIPYKSSFDITVASEIMAILCLSHDLMDFKARVAKIVVAYDEDDKPVTAHDLKAEGALALLMKDAIRPNLVQTLEGTPAIIHGGPFANIAHGCNSLIATKLGLELADYVVTEAGFGADLGAEKFFDLKCRMGGLTPDAAVIVATVRALKTHGGVDFNNLAKESLEAIRTGFANLRRHIENVRQFGIEPVVVLNHFPTDTETETELVEKLVAEMGVKIARSNVFAEGGAGGLDLADTVLEQIETNSSEFSPIYKADLSIKDKIEAVATKIYGARSVIFDKKAEKQLVELEKNGYGKLLVCIAKTQYSFSDDEKVMGAPTDFDFHIRELRLSAGAGFVVAVSGAILTMPGLPKVPAACNMDINSSGKITGLF
ncbi:MAG: formate--tetrahydrofolate ligase [Candidatus Nanosyncoccaceae bacterium]|jgi:formate--tetrahydrofolate ligase